MHKHVYYIQHLNTFGHLFECYHDSQQYFYNHFDSKKLFIAKCFTCKCMFLLTFFKINVTWLDFCSVLSCTVSSTNIGTLDKYEQRQL